MTDVVIVADDLTGAADSAASIVRRGRTSVLLDPAGDWPQDDVLAVDTDSRHTDAATASSRVAEVVRRARGASAEVVKKIDSTLRGNIAVELSAIRDTLGAGPDGTGPLLVVAPAFPATGRTTRGGVVHVDGRRLEAHGSDGDVVALLRRGGLNAERRDAPRDARSLAQCLDEVAMDVDAIVVDADTDEHLAAVVAAVRRTRRPTVLVGSGGLTRPLAGEGVTGADASARQVEMGLVSGGGPQVAGHGATLVVMGSYAPIARQQRSRLVAAGVVPVILDGPAITAARLDDALVGSPAVLSPDPGALVVRADAPRIAADLATTVKDVLHLVGTLVLTGGETARAVLATAGIFRLQVIGEVEPGVVRMHVPELALDVITKAGAFGDENTLLRSLPGHPAGHRPAPSPRKDMP